MPRVPAFLRENILIYEPTEHPDYEFLEPNTLTIKDVLADVHEVRHDIAHGDRIPDRFFAPGGGRPTLNGVGNYIAVMDDSLSFIIGRGVSLFPLYNHTPQSRVGNRAFRAGNKGPGLPLVPCD